MRSNEIAKLAGCTVRTLRHYHAIGLLPEPPRSENGYRDYGARDLARILRVKRLASLGFSLDRIGEVLEQMDAYPPDEAGARAHDALDELDRELAAQIERLEEQRRTIARLKAERLDPDLPVRFAQAVRTLIDYNEGAITSGEREALLITGHFYTESDAAELERVIERLHQLGLFEQIKLMSDRFDKLPADTPRNELDQLVEEALGLIDPIIDCFDSANWEDPTNPEDAEMERFVDELMREDLNPAQIYAEDRLEAEMKARILARRESRPDMSKSDLSS
ncbi:MerR family transcriptional regulator [Gordonibacter sp. An230]|uniref:MerR family transcriptional regulator n=1 Tax=Gordonibacter sp. An230 TaxID=1965592 RepID=UPI000B36ED05|nr:MerR family transcriptional regulator [Gordonibacter sp. An230]OUO86534.1 MerR family transcriptional regulator [Gordonibacter sp. An230]